MADTTPSSGGTTTSFSNTPQAQCDLFTYSITGLTEDTGTIYLSVLANDLGGTAKTLYSVDDGTSTGPTSYSDLLQKDVAGLSSDTSAMGARIWVNTDGTVGYSTTGVDRFQQLAVAKACKNGATLPIERRAHRFPSYDQKKKRKPTCMTRCPDLPLTPPNTGESGSLMMLPKFA